MMRKKDQFYISEHKWYWTPSEWTVEFRLKNRKLDAGADNVQFAQELARYFYHKMIKNKRYVDEYFKDESKLNEYELAQAAESKEFYKSIWEKYIPGMNPIEKALNLLALLKKQNESQGKPATSKKDLMNSDVERALERIPDKEIFESSTLNEIMDRKEGLDDFDRKVNLMNKIAMVERFGKTFDVKKTVAEKRVTNSKVNKQKRLIEYSELPSVLLYQRILPNYQAKLVTKDLIINSPVVYEESKQKIIMLVDYSGSIRGVYEN